MIGSVEKMRERNPQDYRSKRERIAGIIIIVLASAVAVAFVLGRLFGLFGSFGGT